MGKFHKILINSSKISSKKSSKVLVKDIKNKIKIKIAQNSLTRAFHTRDLGEEGEDFSPFFQAAFHIPKDNIIEKRLSAMNITLKWKIKG